MPAVRVRSLSQSGSAHPEALGPGAAWRYALQVRILALVIQVHGVGDSGHRLEADEVLGLAVGGVGLPHNRSLPFRPEKNLHHLAGAGNVEAGAAIGVAIEIDKTIIERAI